MLLLESRTIQNEDQCKEPVKLVEPGDANPRHYAGQIFIESGNCDTQ